MKRNFKWSASTGAEQASRAEARQGGSNLRLRSHQSQLLLSGEGHTVSPG